MMPAYKLNEKQYYALDKAHEGLTTGLISANLNIYFVKNLPWQPWGNYSAKIWGENNIYIKSSRYRDLPTLLSSRAGRELLCHESVHQAQLKQLGSWTKFMLEYAKGFIFNGFNYRNIPLEIEAYAKQSELATRFEQYMV